MIDAYPGRNEPSHIDHFPRELLSRPEGSVGNDEADSITRPVAPEPVLC